MTLLWARVRSKARLSLSWRRAPLFGARAMGLLFAALEGSPLHNNVVRTEFIKGQRLSDLVDTV